MLKYTFCAEDKKSHLQILVSQFSVQTVAANIMSRIDQTLLHVLWPIHNFTGSMSTLENKGSGQPFMTDSRDGESAGVSIFMISGMQFDCWSALHPPARRCSCLILTRRDRLLYSHGWVLQSGTGGMASFAFFINGPRKCNDHMDAATHNTVLIFTRVSVTTMLKSSYWVNQSSIRPWDETPS